MSATAVDTSVLVAGVLEWHEAHAVCRAERARWKRSRRKPSIPAHALLESNAVLTRLPAGYRLRAEDAREVLEAAYAELPVAPLPEGLWNLVAEMAERGVTGGAVYDAVILASAAAAGADELVTLDLDDFERLAPGTVRVRPPDGG